MPQKIKKQANDVVMERGLGRADDIVILVIGPTGSGKSTFINNVLRKEAARVSDGHKSCTETLAHYFTVQDDNQAKDHIRGRRIVLLDTPGLDAPNLSDSEILRRIDVWLAFSHDFKMTVGGLIYMYRIWPNRISRNDHSNMKITKKICGKSCLSKVVLATTFWDGCPADVGEKRTKELAKLFSESVSVTQTESKVAQLYDSYESAQHLLDLVLQRFVGSRSHASNLAPIVRKRAKPPKPIGDDVYLTESNGRKGDILILVMGPLGAGKSTFVNDVLGRKEARVDDSFEGCTSKMTPYILERDISELVEGYRLGSKRIVLVDTPGLGLLEPEDIQHRVAYWLSLARDIQVNVAAAVYIVSLEPRPRTRTDSENIETFQRLCQHEGLPNVTLATTRWNLCSNPDQLETLKERVQKEFWGKFPSSEPELKNCEAYQQKSDSATEIMRVILSRYADSCIDGAVASIPELRPPSLTARIRNIWNST